MHMFENRYRKIVRFGGVYDLIATLPLALPGLVSMQLETLEKIQKGLGLSGQFPVFEPFQLFFLNLFGSLAVIWGVLRIIKPEPLLGLTDGIARAGLSGLMLYYLIVWNIPQVVVLFVVPEILFGIAQLGGYWRYRQSQSCHNTPT